MEHEYKIVQANTPFFRKTEQLRNILKEEAQSGWELIEKIDNYKIRLQRHIKHRDDDSSRSLDPYRVHVGPSNTVTYGAAALITAGIVIFILRLVGAF